MNTTLRNACAALVFAGALCGASAHAQTGMFGRVLAHARAQAEENRVRVEQSGSNNGAAVSQTGAGNDASVAQVGSDNSAILRQNGDANAARLVQVGTGNSLAVTQNSSNNALCFVQRGDDLGAAVVQNGGDRAVIVQNRHRTRVLTDRVPRACQSGPPPVQRRDVGSIRVR